MMLRTCTVQVNLDFSQRTDLRDKLRVGLALQPIPATALFANSLGRNRRTASVSLRSEIWRDTDPVLKTAYCRTILRFETYAELGARRAECTPSCGTGAIARHDGAHVPAVVAERCAGRASDPRAQNRPLEEPSLHAFPRGAAEDLPGDAGRAIGGPWRRMCALPALWVGLLYDQVSLDAAKELIATWSAEERQALRDEVPRTGLATPLRNRTVLDIARRGGGSTHARASGDARSPAKLTERDRGVSGG